MAIVRLPSESPKVHTDIFCGVWGQGNNEEQGLSALQHAGFNDTSIRESFPERSSHLSWSQSPSRGFISPTLSHFSASITLWGCLDAVYNQGREMGTSRWDLSALVSTALSPDEMLWAAAGHVSLQEWLKGLAMLSKSCYGTKGRPSILAKHLLLKQ